MTIPAASLKQSVAIIGRTGSGKTYTAKGLVEQLLRDHWRAKMGNGSRRSVFEEILSAYPKEVSQAEIARRAGVELGGSTWRGHLAFMRGLELVTGRDKLRASDDLFQ